MRRQLKTKLFIKNKANTLLKRTCTNSFFFLPRSCKYRSYHYLNSYTRQYYDNLSYAIPH